MSDNKSLDEKSKLQKELALITAMEMMMIESLINAANSVIEQIELEISKED